METVCQTWLLRHQPDEALPAGQDEGFSAPGETAYCPVVLPVVLRVPSEPTASIRPQIHASASPPLPRWNRQIGPIGSVSNVQPSSVHFSLICTVAASTSASQLLPVWQPPLWSPDSSLPSKPRFHTELLKGKFPSLSHCWWSSPPHDLSPPIPCTLPCFLPCSCTALSWSSQVPNSFLPQDLCTCCFLCLDCCSLMVSRGSVWLFRALFRCRHLQGALLAFSELLLREPPPGRPFPLLLSVVAASMTLIMIGIYYLLICVLGYHPFSQ